MAQIYLVTGAPASGKSTAGHALAARFPKSIHINVDILREMVVSGLELPSPEWPLELAEQLRLARESATHIALTYNKAGFTVVIDDFWDPNSQLIEYTDLFSALQVRKVVLYPTEEQALERNSKRFEPGETRDYLYGGIRHSYNHLNKVIHELIENGWIVLNTTNDSVEETVSKILESSA